MAGTDRAFVHPSNDFDFVYDQVGSLYGTTASLRCPPTFRVRATFGASRVRDPRPDQGAKRRSWNFFATLSITSRMASFDVFRTSTSGMYPRWLIL